MARERLVCLGEAMMWRMRREPVIRAGGFGFIGSGSEVHDNAVAFGPGHADARQPALALLRAEEAIPVRNRAGGNADRALAAFAPLAAVADIDACRKHRVENGSSRHDVQ